MEAKSRNIQLTDEEWMLLIFCLGAASAVAYRDGMTKMSDSILKLYNEKIKDVNATN